MRPRSDAGVSKPVPLGDAAQILIGHRNRMAKRVEQNRVGCLLAHAGQRKQPFAQ